MALYCTKCEQSLASTLTMTSHVTNCWGDLRNQGQYAGLWDLAIASPQKMMETYFTTINPGKVELEYPKTRDVIWDGMFHTGVRVSVQEALKGILNNALQLKDFDFRNFQARLDISGTVANENVYYRKMSQGEWNASDGEWQADKNPFAGAFTYTNTPAYRYWMSSSLAKVQAFGNDNSTDAAGIVAKIEFTASPLATFRQVIKAHQEAGVQADSAKVAIHREGFAEIGSVAKAKDVEEIITPNPKLDFNLGFTVSQSGALFGILKDFTTV